jgi:catechol 2,3-dioxygenase-like lactoylglutathione lyase family enzyme
MARAAQHHVGLGASDLERALGFYVAAFGAEVLARPFTIESEEVARRLGGPPEKKIEQAMVLVPPGTMIELFRFRGDDLPDWVGRRPGLVPHLAFQVDDVAATLELVERNGGSRIWPEVADEGMVRIVYCQDPDGNTIELIDISVEAMVEMVHGAFPGSRP